MIEKLKKWLTKWLKGEVVFYIGGADVLPSPLKSDQEQQALEHLQRYVHLFW